MTTCIGNTTRGATENGHSASTGSLSGAAADSWNQEGPKTVSGFEASFARGLDLSEFDSDRSPSAAAGAHGSGGDDGSDVAGVSSRSSIWLAQRQRQAEWQLYQNEEEQRQLLHLTAKRTMELDPEQQRSSKGQGHNNNYGMDNSTSMGRFYSTLVGMHGSDPVVEKNQAQRKQYVNKTLKSTAVRTQSRPKSGTATTATRNRMERTSTRRAAKKSRHIKHSL